MCFCFKQKTAYEMRISDWSSDVCSSDLWEAKLVRFIQSAMAEGDLYAPSILLATKAAIGSIVWLIVWYDPKRSQTSEKCERIAAGVADFVIAGLHQRALAGQA